MDKRRTFCKHWSVVSLSCKHGNACSADTPQDCSWYQDANDPQAQRRCLSCAWWNERGFCYCPAGDATAHDPNNCPRYGSGYRQQYGDAGNTYTGGKGSRPWHRMIDPARG